MREIDGYGGAEFGQFSLHLKDGDPNDLPVGDVLTVLDRWTSMIQTRPGALNHLQDHWVKGDKGLDYLIMAPDVQSIYDRKIYIMKARRSQNPMKFKTTFSFDFLSRSDRRLADDKKWWRRIVG